MKTASTMAEYLDAQVKKYGTLDQAEECVLSFLERGNLMEDNLWSLLKLLRSYEKKAAPGNYYARKLENEYGYCLDYSEADHGTHWTDN